MRIPSLLTLALAGALSMTMAACNKSGTSAGPVQAQGPAVGASELILTNNSAEPIFYIHMSPSSDTTWGEDLLGSSVLHVGEQFRISGITPGLWDIRVVDSSGNYKELRQQTIGSGGSYSLEIDSFGWAR